MTTVHALRIELRHGDQNQVFEENEIFDHFISDPPYSPKTHQGHNSGMAQQNGNRQSIGYQALTESMVHSIVASWVHRIRGWFVVMTDHISVPWYTEALECAGRYVFAPIAFLEPGKSVRLAGDGPACWSTQIVVARPKTSEYGHWGALPGGYVLPKGKKGKFIIGGKPLWIMRELVKHYSKEGQTIVDPFAGGGTTLMAASLEGRFGIGSEIHPVTFRIAEERITEYGKNAVFIDSVRKDRLKKNGR